MGGMLGDDMGLVGVAWNPAQMNWVAFDVLIGPSLRLTPGQNHSSHIIFISHYEEDRHIRR